MREPSDSAAAAAEILDGLGTRWALVGALAAARYRVAPRLTTDADFLVENSDGVAAAFRGRGYDVREIADPGQPAHMLLVRGHGDRIDILFPETEYQTVALDRQREHILTVEDVIIHKLIAWRPRDRDDIASILEAGHPLDGQYIAEWAEAWGVLDRWNEARARA
jgi:hypothetical protein